MNRLDLVEKANMKDPNLFRDEFMLMDPANIPKPNMDKLYENDIWNEWEEETEGMQKDQGNIFRYQE
jgi:hypothetical protein